MNDLDSNKPKNGPQRPEDKKERSAFMTFLKQKGFYIAIVLCVMAAVGITYAAVAGMLERLNPQNGQQEEDIWNEPEDEQVIDPYDSLPLPQSESDSSGSSPDSSDTPAQSTLSDVPLSPVYILPTNGEPTNLFSGDTLVKSATMGDWRTHNGVDFHAVEGTEVFAVYSGEVAYADEHPLWGYTVVLKLDTGYTVLYGSLSTINGLQVGQLVSQGDVIGTVGSSSVIEKGEGPHLHFEVHLSGGYVDPLELLGIGSGSDES